MADKPRFERGQPVGLGALERALVYHSPTYPQQRPLVASTYKESLRRQRSKLMEEDSRIERPSLA
jgi:hypothetical protein